MCLEISCVYGQTHLPKVLVLYIMVWMPRAASNPYILLKYRTVEITSLGLSSFPQTWEFAYHCLGLPRAPLAAMVAGIMLLSSGLMVGAVGEDKGLPWLQAIPRATNS